MRVSDACVLRRGCWPKADALELNSVDDGAWQVLLTPTCFDYSVILCAVWVDNVPLGGVSCHS